MAATPKKRASLAILKKIDPADVIEWHANGESIASMRRRLEVTRDAWYQWVKSHDGLQAKLRVVREERAADLPWEGLEMIDNADPKEVGKVREQVRARFWIAEHVAHEFKPKQEVNVTGNIIHQHLAELKASQGRRWQGEVLEAEDISEGDDIRLIEE